MAVKTMAMGGGDGKFNDGWHELAIATAEYGTYKSPNGEKKYLDLTFDGYPENMNLRVYEVYNKKTNEEFSIANIFKYANAGIIAVLKDPTGKKPVIQYDDEASGLVGASINVFFYKETKSGKGYSRMFNSIAPVVQEGEHITYTEDQVAGIKASVEKRYNKSLELNSDTVVADTTVTAAATASPEIPF